MSVVGYVGMLVVAVDSRLSVYRKVKEYNDRNVKEKLWFEMCGSVVTDWCEISAEQKGEKFHTRCHYCRFCDIKMDDTNVDESRWFLLSLPPSFRQFNYEQKFLARMEILKILRHVKLPQNLDTYLSWSLPSISNAMSLQSHSILQSAH
jgi:hypothetical protein